MPDTAAARTEVRPATLGWRLLAIAYDALPLLGLWFATAALWLLLRGGQPVAAGSASAWLELIVLVLVSAGYFCVSWRRGGQTLGARAWRLRLVLADGHGTIPWPNLVLRAAVALLGGLALGLGFLWSLLDGERRTWHDRASGTALVRVPKSH